MKNLREFFKGNSWWGKILGAVFGFLAGGPVGAFFGILIGNFFDRGLASHFSQPYWDLYAEKREAVQAIFFHATFAVMGHLAKADGRVSENEIRMAESLMKDMRLKKESRTKAKAYFREGKSPDFNLHASLDKLYRACYYNPELLKLFVDIQYQAAQTDGLTAKKIEIINAIFKHLGLAPLNQQYRFYQDFHYQQNQDHFSGDNWQKSQRSQSGRSYQSQYTQGSSLDQAYALLELKNTASKQEVKKAYRTLISKNHPDKLLSKGLPEEMIKMANEKTQKIRKAYEYICTSKGWHH